MFTFREARDEDINLICSFPQSAQELFYLFAAAKYPLTYNQLKKSIEQRFSSTVILYDSKVIGFANFYEAVKNNFCCIGNVVIKPDIRGKGAAKRLIKKMTEIAINSYQVKRIEISCFNENTKALLLYTKLGFNPYEIEIRKDFENKSVLLIKLQKVILQV